MGIEMDMLAVGNGRKSGDAIMLRFGDLHKGGNSQFVMVIDGGYAATADKIKRMLEDYYMCRNSDGKYVIDLMVLSHTDSDHVSGLAKLTGDKDIQVDNVLMRRPWEELDPSLFADGRITRDSLIRRLKECFPKAAELEQNLCDSRWLSCEPQTYPLYDLEKASLHILGPSTSLYRRLIAECEKTPDAKDIVNERKMYCSKAIEEEDFVEGQEIEWNEEEKTSIINETSLVLLLEYGDSRILFTGDAGKIGLTDALDYADENDINLKGLKVVKLPHHGSRKNLSPDILDRIYSEDVKCYISCAKDDEGHHPSKRLVNLLNQKGFKVITSSGSNIWWHRNAPGREAYTAKATPLDNYPTMDKL